MPLLAANPIPVQGQIFGVGLMAVLVGLGMWRRMRAQVLRPNRMLVSAAMVALVTVASFAAAPAVLTTALGLVLAPLCLLAGVGIGVALIRFTRIWRESATGQLWMQGGAAFALIFVAVLALRMGVRFAATGSVFGSTETPAEAATPLSVISSDLLLLSVGMWAARAAVIYKRYGGRSA